MTDKTDFEAIVSRHDVVETPSGWNSTGLMLAHKQHHLPAHADRGALIDMVRELQVTTIHDKWVSAMDSITELEAEISRLKVVESGSVDEIAHADKRITELEGVIADVGKLPDTWHERYKNNHSDDAYLVRTLTNELQAILKRSEDDD